jgi:glutaminase
VPLEPLASTPETSGSPVRSGDTVEDMLLELHSHYSSVSEGTVYPSGSRNVDRDAFGIAIATLDGGLHVVGDTDVAFPIQSTVKPFLYSLALEDNGPEAMLAKVGNDATGLPYDSLIASQVRPRKTQNPMVSAGAIATTSLIHGRSERDKRERARAALSRYAGRPLGVDRDVYEYEMTHSIGSRARAAVLAADGRLYADVDATVRRYLAATSLAVTAVDLALIGATLANGGVNPRTGERAVPVGLVKYVLSTMTTAGMYDSSGEWLFEVGVPAKSGVSGNVLAVVPGRFAVATYSPPLDSSGNSVRAKLVLRELSERCALHVFTAHRELDPSACPRKLQP